METESTPSTDEVRCTECGTLVGEDHVVTEGGAFCRPCFDTLTEQLHEAVAAQSHNINYPFATIGAVLGGAVGAVVWWGFTILTNISFGLVAVVIGIAVAKGAILFSGNKRSIGLQALSVLVSALSFFYAGYLVNRSLVVRALQDDGQAVTLPFLPSLDLMYEIIALDFGVMDLVFLAIVLWQAWKIPAPFKLTS